MKQYILYIALLFISIPILCADESKEVVKADPSSVQEPSNKRRKISPIPFKWGCYARQGDLDYMQDYHVAKTEGDLSFFGIFDGHGHGGKYGHLVADATANGDQATEVSSLWSLVSQGLKDKSISKETALIKAFKSMDSQFPEYNIAVDPNDRYDRWKYQYAGTTATVALLEQPSENEPGSINLAWLVIHAQ